jgi:hypothetical protein
MIDALRHVVEAAVVVAICLGWWAATEGRREAERDAWRRGMREKKPRR